MQARDILQRLPYEPGLQRGLVLGAGPVGLLGAMVLVTYGLDTVVYSRESDESDKARLVRSLGGTYISSAAQPFETLPQQAGEFDVVFEASGFAPLMMAATQALHANGVAVLTGVPAEGGSTDINVGRALRNVVLRNQVVFGTVNAGRRDYIYAIQHLEQFMMRFPDSVRQLITQRRPLGEAAAMLQQGGGIENVVNLRAG